MATFYPDSEIYLLKEIPFSPDYRNTGLFASRAQQELLFRQKAFYHAAQCTYVRETGRFKLEIPIAVAYQCNYIMFKNTAFQDKWFYAFCTGVAYVNNVTSEFTFTLDIMQTWLFDYVEKPCFIERQHTPTDNLGGNIIPEGLEIGELIEGTHNTLPVTKNNFYVLATFDKQLNNYNGGIQNNIYTGLCINEFTSAADVTAFINSATSANKLPGIVGIFQAINAGTIQTMNITLDKTRMFGGYTPKNNKLYTYPYCFLQAFDNNGGAANFRWEYFNGAFGSVSFSINTTPGINSQMCIYPNDYKGVTGYNPLERMIIENVCLCAWNADTFKANMAQTIGKYAAIAETVVNTLGATSGIIEEHSQSRNDRIKEIEQQYAALGNPGALESLDLYGLFSDRMRQRSQLSLEWNALQTQSLTGKAAGAIAEAGSSTLSNAMTQIATVLKAIKAPDSLSKQAQNPGGSTDYLYMVGHKAPVFVQRTITPYYAKIIDDYFTMYGYQINRIQLPNKLARNRFTFLKTVGAIIEAKFPAAMAQAIENIYNNGICFWYITGQGTNTFDNVGNYDIDNSPIMG